MPVLTGAAFGLTLGAMETLHATCVAIDGAGVLLFGESGAGKSDLALRLIDRGAQLVADDYSELTVEDGALTVRVPQTLAGMIEIRGLGLVRMDHAERARLVLAVELVPRGSVERMPPDRTRDFLGITIPHLHVDPFEISAAAKVAMAVRVAEHKAQLVI